MLIAALVGFVGFSILFVIVCSLLLKNKQKSNLLKKRLNDIQGIS